MDTITLHGLLDDLIKKYGKNEYVYGRLCNYMEKLLPVALENSVINYKQREERKKQLTCDKDEFTNRFLNKNIDENNIFLTDMVKIFKMLN